MKKYTTNNRYFSSILLCILCTSFQICAVSIGVILTTKTLKEIMKSHAMELEGSDDRDGKHAYSFLCRTMVACTAKHGFLALLCVNLVIVVLVMIYADPMPLGLHRLMNPLRDYYSLQPLCPASMPLNSWGMPAPTIFLITPTRYRNEQRADLTRMGQTLRLVPNLKWIVVEDNTNTTGDITKLLQRSCVHFTHLAAKSGSVPRMGHARGGIQRNKGLQWLRETQRLQPNLEGVMYFADDDNTYDVKLFEYIRKVNTVGIWAVGLVGGSMVETPKVTNQTVVGWDTAFAPYRTFATDMAGFAVNLRLIIDNPTARFHEKCRAGMIEPCFLDQLNVTRNSLEPFGFDETPRSVLVWHTRTKGSGSRGGSKGFIVT